MRDAVARTDADRQRNHEGEGDVSAHCGTAERLVQASVSVARNRTIGPFGMGKTVAVIVLHHIAVVMLTGRRRLVVVMAPAPEQQARAVKPFFAAKSCWALAPLRSGELQEWPESLQGNVYAAQPRVEHE